MSDLDEELTKMVQTKQRKYAAIWAKLQADKRAIVYCTIEDVPTLLNAVKKEKSRDHNKQDGFILSSAVESLVLANPAHAVQITKGRNCCITFRLILDMSVRAIKEL